MGTRVRRAPGARHDDPVSAGHVGRPPDEARRHRGAAGAAGRAAAVLRRPLPRRRGAAADGDGRGLRPQGVGADGRAARPAGPRDRRGARRRRVRGARAGRGVRGDGTGRGVRAVPGDDHGRGGAGGRGRRARPAARDRGRVGHRDAGRGRGRRIVGSRGCGDHLRGREVVGAKSFVLDGHIADLVLVAARGHGGVGIYAVEDVAALSREVLPTLDQTRKLARVGMDGVPARRSAGGTRCCGRSTWRPSCWRPRSSAGPRRRST